MDDGRWTGCIDSNTHNSTTFDSNLLLWIVVVADVIVDIRVKPIRRMQKWKKWVRRTAEAKTKENDGKVNVERTTTTTKPERCVVCSLHQHDRQLRMPECMMHSVQPRKIKAGKVTTWCARCAHAKNEFRKRKNYERHRERQLSNGIDSDQLKMEMQRVLLLRAFEVQVAKMMSDDVLNAMSARLGNFVLQTIPHRFLFACGLHKCWRTSIFTGRKSQFQSIECRFRLYRHRFPLRFAWPKYFCDYHSSLYYS